MLSNSITIFSYLSDLLVPISKQFKLKVITMLMVIFSCDFVLELYYFLIMFLVTIVTFDISLPNWKIINILGT